MREINTCGLSCPQPVLMFQEASRTEKEMDVLVDNEASRENVTRAAKKKGYQVNPVDLGDGVTRLELR
ncbi:MAG: sulfurtransferase TusA family protein [Desulfovibrio sp.]|nr:sulfurtransferase TusA family protein [Desulfovibrio sp.]